MIQIIMQKMDSFCVSLNVYVGRRRFRRPVLRRNYPKNVWVRLDEPRKKRRKRKMEKKQKRREEKGITLVALVVTILFHTYHKKEKSKFI